MYKSVICRFAGRDSDITDSLDIINKDNGEIKYCKHCKNGDFVFIYEVPSYGS